MTCLTPRWFLLPPEPRAERRGPRGAVLELPPLHVLEELRALGVRRVLVPNGRCGVVGAAATGLRGLGGLLGVLPDQLRELLVVHVGSRGAGEAQPRRHGNTAACGGEVEDTNVGASPSTVACRPGAPPGPGLSPAGECPHVPRREVHLAQKKLSSPAMRASIAATNAAATTQARSTRATARTNSTTMTPATRSASTCTC